MILSVAASAALAVAILLALHWPFSPQRFSWSLSAGTGSRITFGRSSLSFFPSPGLTAWQVSLHRGSEQIATLQCLKVTGSWMALLTFQHTIDRMELDGLVLSRLHDLPPRDPSAPTEASKTTISSLIADGAIVQATPELQFRFEKLRLRNLGPHKNIDFETAFQNPNPLSRITAKGRIGPWNSDDIWDMPVNGSFTLAQADMSQYEDLAGILSAKGTVSGHLSNMKAEGEADVSAFEVNHNGHHVLLQTSYSLLVNGHNGDTTVQAIDARLLQTHILVHGEIVGSAGTPGKTAKLELVPQKARVEDLLLIAVKERPALNGPIEFRAHVTLPPPSQGRFLKRVQLQGAFRIPLATFSKAGTQLKVDDLSSRARKNAPPSKVFSGMSASLEIRNGLAYLHDARFTVPGATAIGGGIYNLITKDVKLDGTMAMESTVSESTTGIKSVLLKPFDALFRNRPERAGAELPVHITGRYPNPHFEVGLFGKKRRR